MSGSEVQRAAGGGVVARRDGVAVGGGVVHGHSLSAGCAECHGEDRIDGAGVALDHRDIVDNERRQRIVVDDGAQALAVADDGVGHVGDVDEEGLDRLVERIAVHQHSEAVGAGARRNDLAGQAVGDVIHACDAGAVGGGDVEGDAARAGRCAEADGEGGVAGAGIALGQRHVVDGQRGQIVVENAAGGAGRCADGVAGAGAERDDHSLVGFDGGVCGRIDHHGAGGDAGRDGQRRGYGGVIGARRGAAGNGEVHRGRDQRHRAQSDRVDQIGRTVFVDAGRRNRDRSAGHIVVGDGAGRTGRRADGVAAARGDREDHGFVGFDGGVDGRIDGDGRGGGAGQDADRGDAAGVVGAGGRGAAGGDIDHRRRRQVKAAGDGVDQVGGAVFSDAGRRDRDRHRRRRADGEGEGFEFEIAARAGAGVGDAQRDRVVARRSGGGAADHTGAGDADAGRESAGFQQITVRCDAAGGGERLRERDALDGGGAGRNERKARGLHRAGIALVHELPDAVGRTYTETIAAALGRCTADHTARAHSESGRQDAGPQCIAVRSDTAGRVQCLRKRRAGDQGRQRGRGDRDRRSGCSDRDCHSNRVASDGAISEFKNITRGAVAAVAVVDEPVAAGDTQVRRTIRGKRRTIDRTNPGEADARGAVGDIDRNGAAVGSRSALGGTLH